MAYLYRAFNQFWKDLRESLRGSDQDFTTGNLGRAVTLLAIPMVLELSMQSVFSVVDVFFVARLGPDSVATVGLAESVLTLIFAVATGLAMGTAAIVARRIGEKKKEEVGIVAVQGIYLALIVSIPGMLVGLLFSREILELMGATSGVLRVGVGYSFVMLTGNITIILLFVLNAVFRGAGEPVLAMRVLWLSNIVNILLDPILIFGLGPFPELGVTGAAMATNIGRGIGILYQFWLLFRAQNRISLSARMLEPRVNVLRNLIRVSTGGILQFLIATASWLALVRLIAHFGSAALAGYTIAIRIIVFAILPSWGMSNAAATLVGQNLGASQPERAERSVWLTGLANTVFMVFVTFAFVVWARPIVMLFTSDAEVLPFAVDCLRYVSYGYVFYAYGMVMVQAFNGAGDTYTPTVINFCCYWLFQIPLAGLLALWVGFGAQGVFLAITIAESALAVVAVLVFCRGKWKLQTV